MWEFWGGQSRGLSTNKEALRSVESLAKVQSSSHWGVGTALLAARFARRFSRLYVYRYNQRGVDLHGRLSNFTGMERTTFPTTLCNKLMKWLTVRGVFTGAVHGTDLVALLGDAMLLQVCRRPATPVEQHISTVVRRYFVNFIKFG